MGCSASKGSAFKSTANDSPTRKIEVSSKEEVEIKSSVGKEINGNIETNKENGSDQQSVNEQDCKKVSELELQKDTEEKIASFVEREETDETAETDATTLHDILEDSINCQVKNVIKILCPVDYDYRQTIRNKFKEKYNQDLLDKIIVGDDRHLEVSLLSLVRNTHECLAHYMYQSVKGNHFRTLVDILTGWPPLMIAEAKKLYEQDHRVTLNEDISNSLNEKMSEEAKAILISLSLLQRDEEAIEASEETSNEECEELSQSGRSIINILTTKKYNNKQLASIFQQFKVKYYLDIAESIEIEFQDETESILKAIVEIAEDTPGYFAKQLKEICSKSSINKDRLSFIIVSRQPIDLPCIIKYYEEMAKGSLVEDFSKHLKGDLRDVLTLIVERAKRS